MSASLHGVVSAGLDDRLRRYSRWEDGAQVLFENATRARWAGMAHRARNEEEISLVSAIDDE